ncbi:PRODH [Symbiodinium sp. CCMP2592]|nr:PRODH [Symbiodinium sp. CCMP2592]
MFVMSLIRLSAPGLALQCWASEGARRVRNRAAMQMRCIGNLTSGNVPKAESIEMVERDFANPAVAFKSKTFRELALAWCTVQAYSCDPIVRHSVHLYDWSVKILGSRLAHLLLKKTLLAHFCAGEDSQDILPQVRKLARHNVGGILENCAEALHLASTDPSGICEEIVGGPMSSRSYDYMIEARCDAYTDIVRSTVQAVKDVSLDGFASIKLSGLGNPQLLERLSRCLSERCRLYKRLSGGDDIAAEPFYVMDRTSEMDFDMFKTGWFKIFDDTSEAEVQSMFQAMDADADGLINYLDWSSTVTLWEIKKSVRRCKHRGDMHHATLNEEELQLYGKMLRRVQRIIDLAQELGVCVMIDAEQTAIQPAIDQITISMQRMYNTGDLPLVFGTYQTYLKGMPLRVQRDLQRSRREGWHFGATLVRGAYMPIERENAERRGLESPICEGYEETEDNFHRAIDSVLEHMVEAGKGPGGAAAAEVIVATHNRGSIERTIRKMADLGVSQDRVGFGQLMGQADHLTFVLGKHGYRVYKTVPYGPVDEIVPYVVRSMQENRTRLGSPWAMAVERQMLGQEVARRLRPF